MPEKQYDEANEYARSEGFEDWEAYQKAQDEHRKAYIRRKIEGGSLYVPGFRASKNGVEYDPHEIELLVSVLVDLDRLEYLTEIGIAR
jgi:hypothetical protein